MKTEFERAASLIRHADGLLINSGAGIGVDSGLPDFRGPEGFWSAYPALGRARIQFEAIASPDAFLEQPKLAWGFYGHRLSLYRRTEPHAGFDLLRRLAEPMANGSFVFTSNVDGQFQKAGFAEDRIYEAHGSIHHLQCMEPCHRQRWAADDFVPAVDAAECLLLNQPPYCPRCGEIARPNVLMFGDWSWVPTRSEAQQQYLQEWLDRCDRVVIVEIGAGMGVPTVRRFSDEVGAPLIRINPREPHVANLHDVSIALGALEGIRGIVAALGSGK